MLVIRAEQMDALEAADLLPRFRLMMFDRLRADSSDWFARRTHEQVRAFIRDGVAKAKRLGVSDAPGYAIIIVLMVEFGPEFDTDPAHEWAVATLAACRDDAGARRQIAHALLDAATRR